MSKSGNGGDCVWIRDGKKDERLRKVWGKNVYELVTGDRDALEKTWRALPLAIKEIMSSRRKISKKDEEQLEELFVSAFQ